MRTVQRGITTTFVIIIILASVVAVTIAYFNLYLTQNKKLSAINSFEDCAKHYPVMESYPEQCTTPDGRHFIKKLSEEENKKPLEGSINKEDWETLTNYEIGFSVSYPKSHIISNQLSYINDAGTRTLSIGQSITLTIVDKQPGQSLQSYIQPIIDSQESLTPEAKIESVIINGVAGYRGSITLSGIKTGVS